MLANKMKAETVRSCWIGSVLAAALAAAVGPGCPAAPPGPSVDRIAAAGGHVTIYRDGPYSRFRRNDWSLYAWLTAPEVRRRAPLALIHFDAHSDMHPAPTCRRPDSLRAGRPDAVEAYVRRLSVSSFVLPSAYYGLVQEIYWIQPEISCYRGPPESIRFDLYEDDGWIRIQPMAGAAPLDVAAWSIRSFRGEPVPRALDVEVSAGFASEAWRPGPYTLHCLSLDQLLELMEQGELEAAATIINLDLDYFGTTGALRGYGYLAFSPGSDIALGSLQGTLPVFAMPLGELEREAGRVGRLLRDLDPLSIAASASPDHAHRATLPVIAAAVESAWLGGPRERPLIGSAAVRLDDRVVALSPECPVYADAAGAGRLGVEVRRGPLEGPLEVSLYFDPRRTRDRLIWRRKLAAGDSAAAWELPQRIERRAAYLGPGWELEIRTLPEGLLVWSGAFCLDDHGWLMRHAVESLRADERPVQPDPEHYRSLAPSEIIAEGRAAGLKPDEIQQLLVAHPQIWDHQCRNQERHLRR
ncbi:MAG: hypothetical protein GF355_09080 [Candidatus Eisenbacteria bacterium]|nr:hypothetical protein [Candidatus Eisenbacteria bacterium]